MHPKLRLALPLLALLLVTACIEGNGVPASETRALPEFDALRVVGSFPVEVTVGEPYDGVHVACDENLLEHILLSVEGQTLVVQQTEGTSLNPRTACLISAQTPTLYRVSSEGSAEVLVRGAAAPDLADLSHEGSGELRVEAPIQGEALRMIGVGSGRLSVTHFVGREVTIVGEGSGRIDVEGGEAAVVDVQHTGSGRLDTSDLHSDVALVDATGSGSIWVFAGEHSAIRLDGSGNVTVLGDPAVRDESSNGSGSVFYE